MALAEYYNGNSWVTFDTGVTSVGITSNSSGLSVSGSPIITSGVINLTLGSELQALSAFASNGLMARTGSNTYAARTLVQGTGISITNGDGIFGNPTISVSTIDINTNTTGNLAISRLAAYPSNSSVFLNGSGSWTNPSFSNLITTNLIDYAITINNTNSSAFATGFALQNNGVLVTSFGFNNNTNESYIWNYGTANLKFGTNSTVRMKLLNDGTLDLLNNNLITTGTISARTGSLITTNLVGYASGSIFVANSLNMTGNSITGLANPVNNQDAVTKNYADTSAIIASRISGYPSNSSLFLNGLGSWITPSFSNFITTSANSYAITLNNTNINATDTSYAVQNSGTSAVEFGFNNSTNEAYVWTFGTSSLKFGTASTMRARFLNNGTFDLLTNNLTTSGAVNATTGTLIANNLSAYDTAVIVCSSSLNVTGGYSPYNGSYGYLNSSGLTGTSSGQHSYSINCTNRVKASEFNAVSSRKVKNIIGSGNIIEQEAINIFNSISLSKYTYKDQINESAGEFFGLIAEELEEILPHYVSNDYSFIPNIYKICNVKKMDSDLYNILLVKKLNDISGKKIRILIEDKIIDADIKALKDGLLTIKTDNILPDNIFVYGTYEKCPSVMKQKLFELSMVVLKNILRRIENLEMNIKFNKEV